ncbi:MAG TPA: asparagine synthase (glutamine-hydrolyzing) [Planctomycetota bacterium]|nr:asparagine synthase (glutamine-hydrolyzing) [Planctomycetota bacterium]
MCGIAGVFHFDRDRPVDRALLDRSTDVIAHRGPDGRGVYVDGSVGLGHRRLAIIDTTDAASQPLSNEDGTVWIVFNGEIYNFQSLKDELVQKGHKFRSRSDTETIVHLYEEMGERVVERLRGMFAFAIWDSRKQQLLLARDRIGKKPLQYWTDGRTLRFGSEIKAILEDSSVPREPDLIALDHYLTYGYCPAPETAFKGIRKLSPGHTLTVGRDGVLHLRRYWELKLSPKRTEGLERIEDEILETLDEATKLRMISDVPIGAFLSGGIDSSAIVASMQRASNTPVRTFSIGFEEKAWDESEYARLVAEHVKTDHTELTLKPDALEGIEKLAWHYNEPFADSSLLPTSAVSKLARSKVTVVLSGDGGDEVFVGYGRYTGMRVEERIEAIPYPFRLFAYRRPVHQFLDLLGIGRMNSLRDHLEAARWRRYMPMVERYFCPIEVVQVDTKKRVTAGDFVRSLGGHDARDLLRERVMASDGETWTEKCAHADFTTYLPDDICTKVDIASMAYGLETRAPLLDHVLVEKVGVLPFRLKMRGVTGKWVLRRALRNRLPETTLTRKKMGFGVPIEVWFKGGFSKLLEDVLLDQKARERGILDPAGVRSLIDQHKAQGGQQYPLFTLLMLEIWFKKWIDVAKPVAEPVAV